MLWAFKVLNFHFTQTYITKGRSLTTNTLIALQTFSAFPPKSSILKPSQPQVFNDIDSENIDPSTFASSIKSSKSLQSEPYLKSSSSTSTMQHFKAATSILSKAPAARGYLQLAPALKRKASTLEESTSAAFDRPIKAHRTNSSDPRLKPAAPAPAPVAPAGRSPKSKHAGILSRRRISSLATTQHGLPSIDAALSGTIASYKPKAKPTIKDLARKGWHFKIHEDSKEELDNIMMEHKACTLDLSSDDESRVKARDDRGKENIPPVDGLNAPVRVATAIRASADFLTDEVRSPLTDLNAAEYYAAGCDANSHFLVPAEGSTDSKSNIDQLTTANIDAVLATSEPTAADSNTIDIWESGSAKAENEIVA